MSQTFRTSIKHAAKCFATSLLLTVAATIAADRAHGDVFSWECNSLPTDDDWILLTEFCEPVTFIADGQYIQDLDDDACPAAPEGAGEGYRRYIPEYVGQPTFFVEWRIEADGPNSEIPGGGPSALAVANSFGVRYTFHVARGLARLNRDNLLPEVFIPFEPGVPHTHRLELINVIAPTYAWYIDGVLVEAGIGEGFFPADNARVTWSARSWQFPAVNTWDYIRYGDIAIDESGDFDSDGDVDLRDHFYLSECIAADFRGNGPNIPADPGCEWADTDGDGDVDWADYGGFQLAYSGGDDG
jgi:hypothetical protein